MLSDREIRVAIWLIEDKEEYVIDQELYYVNDEGEEEIRAHSVEIEGDLGGDPPANMSFHFDPIKWRRTHEEIESEIQNRDIVRL